MKIVQRASAAQQQRPIEFRQKKMQADVSRTDSLHARCIDLIMPDSLNLKKNGFYGTLNAYSIRNSSPMSPRIAIQGKIRRDCPANDRRVRKVLLLWTC